MSDLFTMFDSCEIQFGGFVQESLVDWLCDFVDLLLQIAAALSGIIH